MVSAISTFVYMPFYPLGRSSVDISVIWALTAHGGDVQEMQDMGIMS
jgi:hypothetical protein